MRVSCSCCVFAIIVIIGLVWIVVIALSEKFALLQPLNVLVLFVRSVGGCATISTSCDVVFQFATGRIGEKYN